MKNKNEKRILFVRHGESFDDLFNEFGSWSDRELSPQGIMTAFEIAETMKQLATYEIIYSSPLKRAMQTASLLGNQLELRVEEDNYLIERNTYGLLSGVNKDLANEKYPELNAAFLEGKYIHGAERYPDFKLRISQLVKKLMDCQFQNIICVTHGYVITELIDSFTDKVRNSVGNGSMIELVWERKASDQKAKIGFHDKITFTDNPFVVTGLQKRKFNVE
jgi:broad specificity phosphatase PhoE